MLTSIPAEFQVVNRGVGFLGGFLGAGCTGAGCLQPKGVATQWRAAQRLYSQMADRQQFERAGAILPKPPSLAILTFQASVA